MAVLALLALGSSSAIWISFSAYVIGASGSLLTVSLAMFVSLSVAGLSGAVLSRSLALWILSIAVFLPALWFAPPSLFLPAFLLPAGVLFVGLARIREENASRIRLSLRRSLAWGAPFLIASFSLGFALFYFLTVRALPIDTVLPQVSLGPKTGGLLTRALSFFNPDFRSADVSNLTVDEFLRATNGNGGSVGSEKALLPEFSTERLESGSLNGISLDRIREEAVLSAGRERFSQWIGRELSGDERMADVLSEIVNRRVATFSLEAQEYRNLVPSVLALLVFLTVYSILSFLSFLWIFSVRILFALLKAFRCVRVVAVPTERETIQFTFFQDASSEKSASEISNQPS